MTARERARRQHWDLEPCFRHERDPAGIAIQIEIKRWNAEAAKDTERWRALAEELALNKKPGG